jgi:hypothetical protein
VERIAVGQGQYGLGVLFYEMNNLLKAQCHFNSSYSIAKNW